MSPIQFSLITDRAGCPRSLFVSRPLLSFIIGAIAAAHGAASDLAETHWIWGTSPRQVGYETRLQKSFAVESPVKQASLRCQADFCRAKVILNDELVLEVGQYDSLPQAAVKSFLRGGQNRLEVHAVATGGPAAFAVELTVETDDGAHHHIASDSTWVAGATTGPQRVVSYGRADQEEWWPVRGQPSVSAFDDYNQWEGALKRAPDATEGQFQVQPGFEIELLYRARADEGSWISLALDPQGRLLVGREDRGILRLTLSETDQDPLVEIVDNHLRACHGLLWAHGSLYANASDSKALFRLRDTDGDDSFDKVERLKQMPGGTGDHGRNDLVLGPDGRIYLIHGDMVELPDQFQTRVPATREFGAAGRPRGGLLIRTDVNGESWEVVASGLRNPYGIDFNEDSEPFTFDADAERHVGLPWYRPTRMNHLVSGADYGWRATGNPWPMYYPDSLPPNLLTGRSSPTSVKFASRSAFPAARQRALIALDWAYGRVFLVHVIPRGASYSMHAETLLRGRAFNVVDLDFAADGSLYLITGGYKTRSALYRVRFVGPPIADRPPSPQQVARRAYARDMRDLRRRLEALHGVQTRSTVSTAWEFLDHPDRWIRHASRIALEHQPASVWEQRVRQEQQPEKLLPALLALVRVNPNADVEIVGNALEVISLEELSTELQLTAVRIASLVDSYRSADSSDEPSLERTDELPEHLVAQFESLYPSGQRALDRELCQLLAGHGSNRVLRKTLQILSREPTPEDRLHYLMVLASVREGWSVRLRTEFFRLLRGARLLQGDEGMPGLIMGMERIALENVPDHERAHFEQLMEPDPLGSETGHELPTRPFVKKWPIADLMPDRHGQEQPVDLHRGASLYRIALCSRCHRLGAEGRAFGPDLTAVAGRFDRREILESILSPSNSISSRYRNYVVTTSDGHVLTGQVVWNGFRSSMLRLATDPMRLEESIEVSKHDIVSHQESPVSPMPDGLLDTFTRSEILDLLAYIESGGKQE